MTSQDEAHDNLQAPPYPMRRQIPLAPPPLLAKLRRDRPVCPVTLWDGSTAWLATRYRDVRALLADPRLSADPRTPGYPMLSPGRAVTTAAEDTFNHLDPPAHTRFRQMLAGEFTLKAVEQLRPAVEQIVQEQLKQLESAEQPVDLIKAFALPVPSRVICALLGVPYEDHRFFQVRTSVRMDLGADPSAVHAANTEIIEYLRDLVARRIAAPGDDLISRIVVRHLRPGHLASESLVGIARLLLVNGYETTANMIGLGAVALLQARDQAIPANGDPATAAVVPLVEELLRHQTIVHLAPTRAALRDIDIAGVTIRAGEGVITSLLAANHDPTAFAEPHRLHLGRQPVQHLAFGHGIHHCLGHTLARLELRTAIGALLRRLPQLRLAVPLDQLPFKDGMGLYGVHRLPVRW